MNLLKTNKIIYTQIASVLIIVILVFFFSNKQGTISAFFGGAAWIIPNIFFIRLVLKRSIARSAHEMIKDFYLGEVIKLLLSAVLVILIAHFYTLKISTFLIGYIGAVIISICTIRI